MSVADETRVKRAFWKKVKRTMGKVPFLPDAIAMYYCLMDSGTPLWVKASIVGALAYFIVPIDAIPDFILAAGYVDDAGVIGGTLMAIGVHVTKEHQEKARAWLSQ